MSPCRPTAFFGAALLGGAAVASEPFTIADPDSGAAHVVIAPTASEITRKYSQVLAQVIEQMCGSLPAVTTGVPAQRAIVVGTSGEFPDSPRVDELKGENPEAFVLHSTADRLYVIGNSDVGAQQGIFTLLRQLGCRWFFPHEAWTVIPERDTLQIDVSAIDSPDYDYRYIWYAYGSHTEKLHSDLQAWYRHNRQRGWFNTATGHAYAGFVPRSLFEDHPEYFALVDGKRGGNQICTTNPEVIQLAIDYALNAFERDIDNPEAIMVSMEPNDGGGFCEGERCVAVGTISDRVFLFANQVAEAVTRRFPDKYVGLLAYAHHAEPPSFKLHPNVYVQLTTGMRRTEMTFEEQIAGFSDKAGNFGIYDYFSIYQWDWGLPGKARAGDLDYLRTMIPYYHSLGATTYVPESNINWGANGLGYYLAAQLFWDAEADADAIIDDFYDKALGEAAGPVRRFYERWNRRNDRPELNEVNERTLVLSYRDLDSARKVAATPDIETRLDHLMMYLHWLRLRWEFERERDPAVILTRGHELVQFSRRIMDTGLIHTYAVLHSWDWFDMAGIDHGFRKLTELESVTDEMVEAWKTERTDIPVHAEVARLFDEGLGAYGGLTAVDVMPTEWSRDLVRVDVGPSDALLALLRNREESPLFCERATYFFPAEAGESVVLPFDPYPGHTLDVGWTLKDVVTGAVVLEDSINKQRNESARIQLRIPRPGLYMLDPGTSYLKGGRLEFGSRPAVAEASRSSEFTLLRPRISEPLYFFVPRGTESFVLRVHSAGSFESDIRIYGPDGQIVSDNAGLVSGRDLAGRDTAGRGHTPLTFGHDISVIVPAGADNRIWAFCLNSVRSTVKLLGIPPYVAERPDELLVPREAVFR